MSNIPTDFWTSIDRTRPSDPDPASHAEALVEMLVGRGIEGTLDFGRSFDEAMASLYLWDLWGAACYVRHGCGDDAFEYLRAWIIGRGEASWRRAASDPEGWFVDLLAGAPDPEARLAELGVEDAEPLLYAPGLAHQRLTGSWLPRRSGDFPVEPEGDEWAEEELPALFPRLTATLPPGWWEAQAAAGDADTTPFDVSTLLPPPAAAVNDGITAFTEGDYERALALILPVFDDPDAWQLVCEFGLGMHAAYVVGIRRQMSGDPDGASDALRRAFDPDAPLPEIRRALAQVELVRGELAAAADLLDRSPNAQRMDRALAVTLAFRRGDHPAAHAAAREMVLAPASPHEHPWDVAGALVQVALVLVELRDDHQAPLAADAIDALIADAPPDLPLRNHAALVRAGALRIAGQSTEAEELLRSRLASFEGGDRGQAFLELARLAAGNGLQSLAADRYDMAIGSFDRAGERWMSAFVRSERRVSA